MRILHITESLDPKRGGPPSAVTRLAAAQAGGGHEVRMVVYDVPGTREAQKAAWGGIPGFDRVTVREVPEASSRLDRALARGAIPTLKDEIGRADIVHLHEVWLPLIRVGAGTARSMGKPYVLSPHGTLAPSALAEKKFKKRVAMMLGYRRMLAGAAGLCVLNRTEAGFVRELKLGNAVWTNANGIFVDEISDVPPAGTFRATIPGLKDDPFIVFMSRLHPRKGIDLLIDAFAKVGKDHPSLHLVLLGPDEGSSGPIREQLAGLRLEDRVHMPGGVWGRMKLAALSECAVYCLPSRGEGFSMSILEAMGVGAPVVMTRTCNFPEAGEAGVALVTELDASSLAAAFERLLASEQERTRVARAGRDFVLEHYTWPAIARKSVEIYGEALAARR